MEYADKLGIDFLAKHRQALEQALTLDYQAILDASLADGAFHTSKWGF
jgi:hypothetical protein